MKTLQKTFPAVLLVCLLAAVLALARRRAPCTWTPVAA